MNYMEDFEKDVMRLIFVSGLITIIVARFAMLEATRRYEN